MDAPPRIVNDQAKRHLYDALQATEIRSVQQECEIWVLCALDLYGSRSIFNSTICRQSKLNWLRAGLQIQCLSGIAERPAQTGG